MKQYRASTPSRMTALLMAVALLLLSSLQLTAQESFQATHYAELVGADEVPPVETEGYGVAIMQLDPNAGTLEYRITVTGLSGAVTAAHFHAGGFGEIGPPVHTINFPSGKLTATGTWSGLTQTDIFSILTGDIYINVHTQQNPDGEIRSQVNAPFNAFAFLSAENEIPPGTNTEAEGTALLLITPADRSVLYAVNWSGLSGDATSAHFHLAPPDSNGPVIHPITVEPGASSASGTWEGISDSQMAALLNGRVYVNIHTAAKPGGEIRGQVGHLDFYTAAISANNEAPPATESSAEGTGYLISYFDVNTGEALLSGSYVVEGTTGAVGAAHLHRGPVGQSGGIIDPMLPGNTEGTLWYTLSVIGSDSATNLKSGGVYANFHTARYSTGEARGQMIPGLLNLPAPAASVPVVTTGRPDDPLRVLVDRTSGMLTFRFDDAPIGSEGRIILYSSLGQEMAAITMEGTTAYLSGSELPSGMYLAQLIIDGRMMGTTRVMVTR